MCYAESMTTTATPVPVCITTDCLVCEGAGEVGTRQDYWGNWETETCRLCSGVGILSVEAAAEYRAAICAHGVHADEDRLCWGCVGDRERIAAEMKMADPWKAATVGGWDQPAPF